MSKSNTVGSPFQSIINTNWKQFARPVEVGAAPGYAGFILQESFLMGFNALGYHATGIPCAALAAQLVRSNFDYGFTRIQSLSSASVTVARIARKGEAEAGPMALKIMIHAVFAFLRQVNMLDMLSTLAGASNSESTVGRTIMKIMFCLLNWLICNYLANLAFSKKPLVKSTENYAVKAQQLLKHVSPIVIIHILALAIAASYNSNASATA